MESTQISEHAIEYFLSPVTEYLADETVTEVMINGPDRIYIERGGKLTRTDARFENEQALLAAVRNIAQFVGTRITADRPRLDARLPDGSRVHVVMAPCSRVGTSITIRKFSKSRLSLEKLIEYGALTEEVREFLGIAVVLAKNILVSGGTGSGKTSLLNALSGMIPAGERIVTIEDTAELRLMQDHVVPLEARVPDRMGRGGVTIRDLFISSLRMRPDRIIVGECRGPEALDMIQAMTSGHDGSMSTIHANSPYDALNRLETLSLMSSVDLPLFALRSQIDSAIDLIVQVSRFGDGSRGLTHVSEVGRLTETGGYALRHIYEIKFGGYEDGKLQRELLPTGERPGFANEVSNKGHADRVKLTKHLFTSQ